MKRSGKIMVSLLSLLFVFFIAAGFVAERSASPGHVSRPEAAGEAQWGEAEIEE